MIKSLSLSHLAERLSESLGAQLHQGNADFNRVTTDTRALLTGDLFVALRGERFDAHDFLHQAAEQGACALVVEKLDPEIALPQLCVNDTLLALGQIAALNRDEFHAPLLAVTGSGGKTTVKTMLAQILGECGDVLATKGSLNNHIGVPLTLLELQAHHGFAVIEMGASGMGEIAYLSALARPDIALITNVMPAHIAGFGSLANVARAKSEIYASLSAQGTAVVNIDDAFASGWLAELQQKNQPVFRVSLHDQQADCYAKDIQINNQSLNFTVVIGDQSTAVSLNALGEHNIRNALAASACAHLAGASLQHIQRGLAAFSPVAGRMSRHLGYRGARIIDDSYNANPGAVRVAIDVLVAQPGTGILVLGDMGELGENAAALHAHIGTYAKEQGLKQLFTLGELSRHASKAFSAGAEHFEDLASLLTRLKEIADEHTVFLIKGSRSAKTDLIVAALCATDDTTGKQR